MQHLNWRKAFLISGHVRIPPQLAHHTGKALKTRMEGNVCSLLGQRLNNEMAICDCDWPVNSYNGRSLSGTGQGQCAHKVQGIMQGETDHSCCKESSLHLNTRRVAFAFVRQLSAVEWINWRRVSPWAHEQSVTELARPAWEAWICGSAQHTVRKPKNSEGNNRFELASTHIFLPGDWGCRVSWRSAYYRDQ